MLVDILNKVLMVLFFMSILNVVRHAYYFIQAWVKSTTEEAQKYWLTKPELWILGISIAYILTVIINGLFIK